MMPRQQRPRPRVRYRPLVQPKFHNSRGQQVGTNLTVLTTGGTKQGNNKPPPPGP